MAAVRWALTALIVALPAEALATYSIAAVDTATEEIGGAGTSCVGGLDVRIIYGAVPGVGVVHAQALLHPRGRDRAVALLSGSTTPADIITAIASSSFDRDFEHRQYAVVDLTRPTAAFTGGRTGAWSGHRAVDDGRYRGAVAGNILTSGAVIDQAVAGFAGCDLAARLMHALEAGADNGEGDTRCTPRGVPSDSAFIRVDTPSGTRLDLSVTDTGRRSPLPLLRVEYQSWRAQNPCPAVPDAGPPDRGTGPSDVGPADAARGEAASTPDDSAVVDAPASPAGDGGTTSSPDAPVGDDDATATGPAVGRAQGCGCSAEPPQPTRRCAGSLLLLGIAAALRRGIRAARRSRARPPQAAVG